MKHRICKHALSKSVRINENIIQRVQMDVVVT